MFDRIVLSLNPPQGLQPHGSGSPANGHGRLAGVSLLFRGGGLVQALWKLVSRSTDKGLMVTVCLASTPEGLFDSALLELSVCIRKLTRSRSVSKEKKPEIGQCSERAADIRQAETLVKRREKTQKPTE